jgi:hypothetical protein
MSKFNWCTNYVKNNDKLMKMPNREISKILGGYGYNTKKLKHRSRQYDSPKQKLMYKMAYAGLMYDNHQKTQRGGINDGMLDRKKFKINVEEVDSVDGKPTVDGLDAIIDQLSVKFNSALKCNTDHYNKQLKSLKDLDKNIIDVENHYTKKTEKDVYIWTCDKKTKAELVAAKVKVIPLLKKLMKMGISGDYDCGPEIENLQKQVEEITLKLSKENKLKIYDNGKLAAQGTKLDDYKTVKDKNGDVKKYKKNKAGDFEEFVGEIPDFETIKENNKNTITDKELTTTNDKYKPHIESMMKGKPIVDEFGKASPIEPEDPIICGECSDISELIRKMKKPSVNISFIAIPVSIMELYNSHLKTTEMTDFQFNTDHSIFGINILSEYYIRLLIAYNDYISKYISKFTLPDEQTPEKPYNWNELILEWKNIQKEFLHVLLCSMNIHQLRKLHIKNKDDFRSKYYEYVSKDKIFTSILSEWVNKSIDSISNDIDETQYHMRGMFEDKSIKDMNNEYRQKFTILHQLFLYSHIGKKIKMINLYDEKLKDEINKLKKDQESNQPNPIDDESLKDELDAEELVELDELISKLDMLIPQKLFTSIKEIEDYYPSMDDIRRTLLKTKKENAEKILFFMFDTDVQEIETDVIEDRMSNIDDIIDSYLEIPDIDEIKFREYFGGKINSYLETGDNTDNKFIEGGGWKWWKKSEKNPKPPSKKKPPNPTYKFRLNRIKNYLEPSIPGTYVKKRRRPPPLPAGIGTNIKPEPEPTQQGGSDDMISDNIKLYMLQTFYNY